MLKTYLSFVGWLSDGEIGQRLDDSGDILEFHRVLASVVVLNASDAESRRIFGGCDLKYMIFILKILWGANYHT